MVRIPGGITAEGPESQHSPGLVRSLLIQREPLAQLRHFRTDLLRMVRIVLFAMRPIHRAISAISGSRKPRVVTAGVPTRIPLVTKGFSGSLGMVFLFTVMPTSSSRCSYSLPVRPKCRVSTRIRWLSVPPETSRKPCSISFSARTRRWRPPAAHRPGTPVSAPRPSTRPWRR